jgi:hypothetical protein
VHRCGFAKRMSALSMNQGALVVLRLGCAPKIAVEEYFGT